MRQNHRRKTSAETLISAMSSPKTCISTAQQS